MDNIENIVAVLGLITGILSFVAAIISLIPGKNKNSNPPIQINGNENSVNQGNRQTNINLNMTFNKTEHQVNNTSSRAESADSKTHVVILAVIVLLAVIAPILGSLTSVAWMLLIISSLLNIYIGYHNRRNNILGELGFAKVKQVIFLITPILISALFLVQHISFLYNADVEDFVALTKAGTSIIAVFVGCSFLLISQISILLLPRIRNTSFKQFLDRASTVWPISIVVCMLPLIFFLI